MADYSPWGRKDSDMTEAPEHTRKPMEWMSKSFALSSRAEITLETGQAALAKTLGRGGEAELKYGQWKEGSSLLRLDRDG